MRRTLALLAALALPVAGHAADAAHPVVIELFQSQGCSSCPPAAANVAALAGRPDVLALSFQVTYWDQLGWKDIYAKPQFTERQWAYARGLKHPNVFTPQVVINGRADVVGVERPKLAAAIARADRGTSGPALALDGGKLSVRGAGRGDVWLVRYDPRTIQVPIRAGENGGRTLPHRNVVRDLIKLGSYASTPATFAVPAAPAGLATAAFVQAGTGGPILAAVKG